MKKNVLKMAHGVPVRRKIRNNSSYNNNENEIPRAPDGDWGWVVVFSSFLIHVITDGITYSFGVIYVKLLEEFNEGKSYTSWILSLLSGMTLCSGPISSALVNKYGCRAVTIAGSILAAFSMFISYWAENVLTLIITIGVGVGSGFGLIYLPAIVSVSMYFERYRSVATGIAVAGSGIGTAIFAPLFTYLVEHYEWRGTLLILSVIIMNCIFLGALFRPLPEPSNHSTLFECSDAYQRDDEVIPAINGNSKQKINSKSDDMPDILIYKNGEHKSLLNSRKQWPSGALSRPDIFYRGSLDSISNHGSNSSSSLENGKSDENHRLIENEGFSSEDSCYSCFPPETRESFLKMTSLDLLKNPIYVLFVISNFTNNLAFYVPYFYLPDRAKDLDMTEHEISSIMAIIGISNTVGRIIFGYISDLPSVNRLTIYNICLSLCGFATAVSVYCLDYTALATYSAIFGFLIGAYVGLVSVILVDLLGLDKLTNAFGLLLLFQGISSFIGPPIAGLLCDLYDSNSPAFLFAGSMISLSGSIVFFIPKLQKYIERKQTYHG